MLFPEKAKVHVTDKVNCIALTVQVKVMVVSHSGSDWLICYPVWSQRKVQGLYVPGACISKREQEQSVSFLPPSLSLPNRPAQYKLTSSPEMNLRS